MTTLTTCGVAGIGHLGEALTKQLESKSVNIFAYHPDSNRRSEFAGRFDKVESVDFTDLLKQEVVLLALPSEVIHSFLKEAQRERIPNGKAPNFVNLSTLINTKELRREFPDLQIYGVKMIGHANYLYEHGDGVFITETPLNTEDFQSIRFLFEEIGTLFEDNEDIVREVNGLAVKKIIETCVQFKEETKDYPNAYSQKAMDTIFPNTMRLYREGDFDGFMLKIMEEIKQKNKI